MIGRKPVFVDDGEYLIRVDSIQKVSDHLTPQEIQWGWKSKLNLFGSQTSHASNWTIDEWRRYLLDRPERRIKDADPTATER